IASTTNPDPSVGEQVAFAMAAVAAFTLLNVAVAVFAQHESDSVGGKRVLLVATATDFIAVGAGLGTAVGVDCLVSGLLAWLLIPFVAGITYMLVQAVELALGRQVDRS